MSITITCAFSAPYEAQQAAQRLRKRGYMVSLEQKPSAPLLVAYPYGMAGGNTSGNGLMAAMPPIAGNSIMMHTPAKFSSAVLSVLTDDTQLLEARQLLEALGGKIL